MWRRTISAAALQKAGSAAVKIDVKTEAGVESKVVFMAYVEGRLYAIDAVCTHAKCILGIFDPANLTVKCPCHHAVFDLRTGAMLEPPYVAPNAPKEKMGVRTYPIRENEGWIEVEV
ncbi:MAG: sulredoxin [Pyrobaculum sp.]